MADREGFASKAKMLPFIKPKRHEVKKTRKEMRYRAFSKPLTLPSLDLMYAKIDKVSTLFSKKQLSKKVSEWFDNWRPWQQRILLCSLTEKCSKSQLHSLVTSLEPVFHRDFVSQLKGTYPTKLLQPKFVHTMPSMVDDKDFRRYRGLEPIKTMALPTTADSTFSEQMQKLEKLEKLVEVNEIDYESCYHDIAVVEGTELDQRSDDSDFTLADFAVTPATEIGVFSSRRHEHAPLFLRRVSTHNFFPDVDESAVATKLGAMKSLRRPGDQSLQYGGDPLTFKSSKWWQGHKGQKLHAARRSGLSKYFKMQLSQINEWLEEWSPHERVDMLAEVVKCCNPDSLNFFALCVGRRLRDQTSINSLLDHILFKIFSYLDMRSFCQSAQVCRRWRYLSQDDSIWRKRLKMIGISEGMVNLPKTIETLAKNQHIDWKQAYLEVRHFYNKDNAPFVEQQGLPDDGEKDEIKEPLIMFTGVPPHQAVQRLQQTPVKPESPSGHELVDVVVVNAMQNAGPAQTPTTADQLTRKVEFESRAEDQNDLTGGNLKVLAKSLRLLLKQKDEPEEEVALDIRPALIQASNLLDKTDGHTKFRYLSLAVQGVLPINKVTRLQGHMDGVYCLQFDTRRVMTGSLDRTLRIWDVRSGKSIHKIKGHKGGIRCLQFDESKIVTGSWDMTIMVWHIVHFNRLHVLYGHRGCVSCLQFDDYLLVSGSHDKTIRVWDTRSWECLRVIQAHEGTVTCLEFDGRRVLSGSVDRTLKLWDVNSGQMLLLFTGHEEPVASLKIFGNLVMSGSTDGMIMFWDLDNGLCEAAIQAHEGPVHSISTCGDHFISSGSDNLIKEWDMCTCTCLRTLQGHKGPVQCVRGTYNRILSCSTDGTVRIWDLDQHRSQNEPRNIALHENTIEAKVVQDDKNTRQNAGI